MVESRSDIDTPRDQFITLYDPSSLGDIKQRLPN